MYVLSKKLQAIKKELRGWAKSIKEECDKTITKHSNELMKIQRAIQYNHIDPVFHAREKVVKESLINA